MEQLARQTAADNDVSAYVLELAHAAKAASHVLACAATASKNLALVEIANALRDERAAILEANSADLAAASALEPALVDRLKLNDERIEAMVAGVLEVAELPDPVGAINRFVLSPERYSGWPHAGRVRGYRHHLRVPAQRHRGRRRFVFESGQRGAITRRLGSATFQSGHCPMHPGWPRGGCPAGGGRAGYGDDGSCCSWPYARAQ